MSDSTYQLYGSELSPFSMKVRFLLDRAGLSYRWLPADGSLRENLPLQLRVLALRKGLTSLTYPRLTQLDELPLVPYLFGPDGSRLYDSTAIGIWLDTRAPLSQKPGLLPAFPAIRFVCRLLDEYVDEFGLYLLHHGRWVLSARTTRAPEVIAREFETLVPRPLRQTIVARFEARQVRRLPYLFSVAPPEVVDETLPRRRRPPSREGFPPTHAFLEKSLIRQLEAVDALLASTPFLLGERPTLADASLLGQLASQVRLDPDAASLMSPRVRAWVERAMDGRWNAAPVDALVELHTGLGPLLAEIARTFVPLMIQNERAYRAAIAGGQRRCNERAFDRGQALYDGELDGFAFRSVVKTFQVRVWREILGAWGELARADREAVLRIGPALECLDLHSHR